MRFLDRDAGQEVEPGKTTTNDPAPQLRSGHFVVVESAPDNEGGAAPCAHRRHRSRLKEGRQLITSIMKPIRGGQYVGLEKTNEGEYHHLKFSEEKVLRLGDVTWDLWVQSGPQPLVHKVVIVPSESRMKNTEPPIIFETLEKITKTFSDWKVNPHDSLLYRHGHDRRPCGGKHPVGLVEERTALP